MRSLGGGASAALVTQVVPIPGPSCSPAELRGGAAPGRVLRAAVPGPGPATLHASAGAQRVPAHPLTERSSGAAHRNTPRFALSEKEKRAAL